MKRGRRTKAAPPARIRPEYQAVQPLIFCFKKGRAYCHSTNPDGRRYREVESGLPTVGLKLVREAIVYHGVSHNEARPVAVERGAPV